MDKSWLNLHLSPLVHWPCLKNAHSTDFGSTPATEEQTDILFMCHLHTHDGKALQVERLLTFANFLSSDDGFKELVEFVQFLLLVSLLAALLSLGLRRLNSESNISSSAGRPLSGRPVAHSFTAALELHCEHLSRFKRDRDARLRLLFRWN